MKKMYFVSLVILALSMLFFPLAAGDNSKVGEGLPTIGGGDNLFIFEQDGQTLRVLRSESGKIEEMKVEDYLFCVVAAEMPALYETEALKAQAVAAYTYALRKANASKSDYDITDSSTTDQAFVEKATAREKWGSNADLYEEKITSAIKSVLYKKIVFDGKPILAAYHAISSGKTENVSDIWGGDYPYLSSVDSVGDKLSPNYLSTAVFSADEFCENLKDLVELSGDGASWLGEMVRTEAGSVKGIMIGGQEISGDKIRSAFSLRSANFDISFADNKFTFTVRGYGHGIGMSQYGAHYLAMQGKNYKEILLHFYTGCEIT